MTAKADIIQDLQQREGMAQQQEMPVRPVEHQVSRARWKCRTRQELEQDSPSRRDGMSPEREEQKRYAYANLVQDVGTQLKM